MVYIEGLMRCLSMMSDMRSKRQDGCIHRQDEHLLQQGLSISALTHEIIVSELIMFCLVPLDCDPLDALFMNFWV